MSEVDPSISHPVVGARAGSLALGLALIVALVALAGYAFRAHSVSKQLVAQNDALTADLASTRGQLDQLNTKLNRLADEQQSAKPAASHPSAASVSKHAPRHRSGGATDPHWKALQGQISEQGRQIQDTRQELSSTRTELQGSIARTHDELVLMQKKGERNYFEFDVDKSGQFHHNGPIGVRLRKANTKHEYADLELMVDDFKVSKKHVNVFEPVVFYTPESQMPIELVINSISHNHIHGYVSEPKYRASDLQAMAGAANSPSSVGDPQAKPSPERQRLELPKDASQN
jgi:TolA-binding protein